MKNLIVLILLFSCFQLNSKWEPKNTPNGIISINNIYTNGDYYIFSKGIEFYTSINKGQNWEKINASGLDSIGLMNRFYGYEDTLFITSSGLHNLFLGGLYKSIDKGRNWETILENSSTTSSHNFNIANNNYYLLASAGLLKSTDYGQNWDTINIEDNRLSYMRHLETIGDTIMLSDIGIDDKSKPSGFSNYGIYFSFDAGKTFELRVNGIGLDSSLNNVVKMYKDFCFIGTNKGLYISSDFGLNWVKSNLNVPFQEIIKFERNGNNLYVGTKFGEIFKSTNLGENWESVYKSNSSNPILVLQKVGDEIFFSQAGLSTGIYKLTDTGFEDYIIPVPSSNIKNVYDNEKLYLLTNLTGIYTSDDFSETWNVLNDSLYKNRFQKNRFFVEDNILVAYNPLDYYISFSNDFGKTWQDKQFGAMYVSASLNNGRILVTNSNGIRYFSDDGGTTWVNINEQYGENPEGRFYINKILKDNNDLLGVTTFNGIVKSTNNGITWNKLVEQEYPPYFLEGLNNFAFFKNTIIATRISRSEGTGNTILISTDYGKSFKEIQFSDSLIRFNEVINYKENFFISSSLGFHYSTDNGETWMIYNDGLPNNGQNEIAYVGDVDLVNDKLIIIERETLYTLSLSDLGIQYKSVEKTEDRSYLYTYPPYPHPTNQELNIKFYYWNNFSPFTASNIEVYNINAEKLDISNEINIVKTGVNEAKIIWNVSNQKAGTYFIKINYGTETKFQKVLIIK